MRLVRKATQMRFGRASLVLAFLAVIGLGVAGTASSEGTQPVTATTVTVTGATCSDPVLGPRAERQRHGDTLHRRRRDLAW